MSNPQNAYDALKTIGTLLCTLSIAGAGLTYAKAFSLPMETYMIAGGIFALGTILIIIGFQINKQSASNSLEIEKTSDPINPDQCIPTATAVTTHQKNHFQTNSPNIEHGLKK